MSLSRAAQPELAGVPERIHPAILRFGRPVVYRKPWSPPPSLPVYPRNGLYRFSSPMVVVGPCPG